VSENPRVVSVEIHGLRYPIRSVLDPSYVAHLAAYVDAKIQAAAEESPTSESVKVAVVAALNIADEYFRLRESGPEVRDEVARRAEQIEHLVDEALASVPEDCAVASDVTRPS
jgi:cell division protein ZapA